MHAAAHKHAVRPSFGMALLVGILLSGCAASSPTLNSAESRTPKNEVVTAAPAEISAIEQNILDRFAAWEHTPYRWGGTTRRGIDCSAYVKHVYDEAFSVQLPRTTLQQVGVGDPIKKHDLQPGDLVFFLPNQKRTRHVGIYLSDGTFTHASTSKGVTTSNLNEPYWRNSYWTARRILPSTAPVLTAEEITEPSELEPPTLIHTNKKKTKRTGW